MIVIRNVKRLEAKDKEPMPSVEWKALAMSTDEARPVLNNIHGELALDGFRIHFSKDGALCGCKDCAKFEDAFSNAKKDVKFVCAVNRRFLLDALAGMKSDNDIIEIYAKSESAPMLLANQEHDRIAVIMPMHVAKKVAKEVEVVKTETIYVTEYPHLD